MTQVLYLYIYIYTLISIYIILLYILYYPMVCSAGINGHSISNCICVEAVQNRSTIQSLHNLYNKLDIEKVYTWVRYRCIVLMRACAYVCVRMYVCAYVCVCVGVGVRVRIHLVWPTTLLNCVLLHIPTDNIFIKRSLYLI